MSSGSTQASPAGPLRGGKYGCIGLCMFDITRAGNVATLDGIVSAARDCGYAGTLVEFDEGGPVRLRNVARRLAELPVDGMIFNTHRAVEDIDEFKPVPGLPTIIISMKEHPRCTTIDSDQYGCSRMVVDYLRERGHASAARDCGYAVTLVEFDEGGPVRLRNVARRLAELPVDGMIFNTNRAVEDFDEFKPVPGLPTIIISMKEHPRCTTIDSDQYGCSRMVVDYLRERGHAHIRHLAGPEGSITADFRLRGWADALDTAGLERIEPLRGDWTADSGYELGVKLAQDKDMTALYVGNDQMAMGAMTALRIHARRVRRGRAGAPSQRRAPPGGASR